MAWQDLSVVMVIWRDAHADANGWADIGELDPDPCIVHSIGFQLENGKPGHVTLIQSIITDEVDSVLHIPAAMVEEIRHLEFVYASNQAVTPAHSVISETSKPSRVRGTGSARTAHPASRGRSLTDRD